MQFGKFQSIENHYNEKCIRFYKEMGYTEGEWVLTEKVHGANFSLLSDGKKVICGKRGGLIEDEMFYNSDKVMERHHDDVIAIANKLIKEGETLQIYGELFGGHYSHPDVEKVKDAKKVQKGIEYHPDNMFLAFHIVIRGDNSKHLSFDEMVDILDGTGIRYLPALKRGNFDDLFASNPEFESTVPAMYGLPPIENNKAEGYVLAPVKTLFTPNRERVVIKIKYEKFQEIVGVKRGEKREPRVLNIRDDVLSDVKNYITKERMDNVKSKMSEKEIEDHNKVLGRYMADVMKEFEKLNTLTKDEKVAAKKIVGRKMGEIRTWI